MERPLGFIEHGASPVVLRKKSMMRPNSVDARQAPVLGLRIESKHLSAPSQKSRAFERGEDCSLQLVWPQVGLIHDVDDTRETNYGVYYTQRNPLTSKTRA